MTKQREKNELDRRVLSISGLSPWVASTASARLQMFSGSHITQRLVVKGATERGWQTGMEQEFGKYTFSKKAPGNIIILNVVKLYPERIDNTAIKENPLTTVVYEDMDTKEIGIINLPKYCSFHQYFGFEYRPGAAASKIYQGAELRSGDIILDSPAVMPGGGYAYGVESEMVYASIPGVAEDGIIANSEELKKFSYKIFERRHIEFGSKKIPLNLYGDENNYKIMPDIGERVHDGSRGMTSVLMGLRNNNKETAIMDQHIYSLMKLDAAYDTKLYCSRPGGIVRDIRVHHDPYSVTPTTPFGMVAQAEKYNAARRRYYGELLKIYRSLKARHGVNIYDLLTYEFQRLLVEAMGVIENNENTKIQKLYRRAPMDDWRIEFVIEHEIIPDIGAKMTDCHGGKGVIVDIKPPSEMPTDQDGNVAAFAMDANSTVNRSNYGRMYEQFGNACSRELTKELIERLMQSPAVDLAAGMPKQHYLTPRHRTNAVWDWMKQDRGLKQKLELIERNSPELFNAAWDRLMRFYYIINEKMYNWFASGQYRESRAYHLDSIFKFMIVKYAPPDLEEVWPDMMQKLADEFMPTMGPITYIGSTGRRVTTVNPILIGSVYMMQLEKNGDDWAAAPSAKTQCYGVLAQVTNQDKYALPWRMQPIRAYGESEVRLGESYGEEGTMAEIHDRNNNQDAHKEALLSIYNTKTPTNISMLVDRRKVPLGGSKPLQLFNHILECGGSRLVHRKYVPNWKPEWVGRCIPQAEKEAAYAA